MAADGNGTPNASGTSLTTFTTIGMTPMERQMMMEFKTIRRGVRDSVDGVEERVVQRVGTAESRLEARLFRLERMLWTFLPENLPLTEEELRARGAAFSQPPPSAKRDAEADAAAGGGPSQWFWVAGEEAHENFSEGSERSWLASV
mmetsp:Transcript_18637/g.58505  ORF Transcript_18637/g.58505 Transcript_18637/m.58505 type:complete len:146 (+) Transcript_18637:53-490(+)